MKRQPYVFVPVSLVSCCSTMHALHLVVAKSITVKCQMKILDLVACIFYTRPPVSVMRNAGSRAAGLVFEVKICKVFVLTV